MEPLKRNAELEQVILEDPLDPAAWLVYGDWLLSAGDPRGELVAIQARLARDPGNRELMDAQRTLFAEYGDAFLEGLHPYLNSFPPLLGVSWEFGFLWTANMNGDGHASIFMDGLRALLTHPSAHFLHGLTITSPPNNDWERVVQLLTSSRSEPELPIQLLYLGDASTTARDPRPAFTPLGDLSALWPALRHARSLALRGGMMSVGAKLDLPSLRELKIETSALSRQTLHALCSRDWPHLERLELWFGERRCTCTLPDLDALFEGSSFPKLRHLSLRNCAFVDRICHSLATSAKITKQLHVIDLSLGALTDVGLNALLANAATFQHLAVLDLHHHYVDMPTVKASGASKLAGFVDLSGSVYEYDNNASGPPKVWIDA